MKEIQSLFWESTQRFLQEYEKKKVEKKPKRPTQLPKEQTWIIKRDMPRMPKEGKR